MKTVQKGFTLIELMIVVAIIGILAAIAIPAYQNYTIRSQVTEGLSLADGWKTGVAEFYAQNGSFPGTCTASGSASTGAMVCAGTTTGKYVSGVALVAANPGQIQITYGAQANKQISTFVLDISPGLTSNNDIVWICGKAGTTGMAALATAPPADASTVSVQYLPASCHG
jgi:type IV pilus assembly protein PilA